MPRARGGRSRDDVAPDEHVATGRLLEAGDHPQQRGLPRARGAEEDQELAVARDEVDRVYGGRIVAESLRQAAGFDGRHWDSE